MKKEEFKKGLYVRPEIKVYPLQGDNLLQAVSGNAGKMEWGGQTGDAKRGHYEEWEDEESVVPNLSSEHGGSGSPAYNVWSE